MRKKLISSIVHPRYDVQAVEWRRGLTARGVFERDILRESKVARIQVRKKGVKFEFLI